MRFWPADPRLSLPAGLAALLAIGPIATPAPAGAALGLVVAGLILARQPLPWHRLIHLEAFLIVLLLTLPFAVPGPPLIRLGPVSASAEGGIRALTLGAKVAASVLLLHALLGQTPPERLGTALRALRVPETLVRIFLGLTRYLGLIRAEMGRLIEAMRLRSFRPGSNLRTWRAYGHLIGMMLIRALDRADRIEEAMRLRHSCGRMPRPVLPPPAGADWLAAVALPVPFLALMLWSRA